MPAGAPPTPPAPTALPTLSVVCVFNDPAVRRQCLDASLRDRPDWVEYLPVDNVDQRFASAGAALNHAARGASHDVVVFVHQDVYLHSLERLREVAGALTAPRSRWALVGACGIRPDGSVVGLLRDRVVLIGESTPEPVAVDTVDEVMFLVERDLVLEHPLTEDPELAWHAYAVEYGARMRRLGLETGAADGAITHNSMTVNLDRLDVAHRRVAAHYPDQMPLRTTCGRLGAPAGGRLRELAVLRDHGWRRRWLSESGLALRAGRGVTTRGAVLADIRIDVDALVWSGLHVVNLDRSGTFPARSGPLELDRAGRPVRFDCVSELAEVGSLLRDVGTDGTGSVLVTNLRPADVRPLTGLLGARPTRLGVHDHDVWLLAGPVVEETPPEWRHPRAVPLLAGV